MLNGYILHSFFISVMLFWVCLVIFQPFEFQPYAYYMLNNNKCYDSHDLIPTSKGPTRIGHGKKIRNNHSMVFFRKLLPNSLYNLPYLTFVKRYKLLTTFVVETCLFLKACFLSCLIWKVLTFFGICLLL